MTIVIGIPVVAGKMDSYRKKEKVADSWPRWHLIVHTYAAVSVKYHDFPLSFSKFVMRREVFFAGPCGDISLTIAKLYVELRIAFWLQFN